MIARKLLVPLSLWASTWSGLRLRGDGLRESACVWAGTRDGDIDSACAAIFLDDLPGTVGRRLQHRTSREAVGALLAKVRELGLVIVADIHTHPATWVNLSPVDQEHPIEYRVGLLALVLPKFATVSPDIKRTGVHEYIGDGRWRTFTGDEVAERVRFVEEDPPQ